MSISTNPRDSLTWIPKLTTAQQRMLLMLLERGATEVQARQVGITYNRAGTIRVLKREHLIQDTPTYNPRFWQINFTPAGMSIARELRRMRFQEHRPTENLT